MADFTKYQILWYLSSLVMKTCLCTIQMLAVIIAFVGCKAQTKVYTTPNSSMEPTLLQGEKFTAEIQPFQPSRGDLVIFRHEGILLVKRALGISGILWKVTTCRCSSTARNSTNLTFSTSEMLRGPWTSSGLSRFLLANFS